MHIKQPGFTYSVCGLFTKNKNWKKLWKLEIQTTFKKMINDSKNFAVWLIANTNIQLKEHNQIKFWEKNPLHLQIIQNMMDILP